MSEPGKEAEELRSGIEELIQEARDAEHMTILELYGEHVVLATDLQDLLDRVDARDSLAHLENVSKKKTKVTRKKTRRKK